MPLPEKAGGNTIVCVSKQQKVAFCDSSLPFWKAICPFLWASDLKYKWNTAWKSVIYVVYSVNEVAWLKFVHIHVNDKKWNLSGDSTFFSKVKNNKLRYIGTCTQKKLFSLKLKSGNMLTKCTCTVL